MQPVVEAAHNLPARDVLEALRAIRLPREFFARDARVVARALIGCRVVHEMPRLSAARRSEGNARIARIVETEAYRGPTDLACHARAGLTKRTRSLFGVEGHAYVFLVYGMHECFNVTCGGNGWGHAVLVRAAEGLWGCEAVDCPDGFHGPSRSPRLDGPGRFARAMAISRADDGHDVTVPPLYICPRERRPRVVATPRVGVAYAGKWADRPWRFLDADSRAVSNPPKKAIGRPLP